MKTHSKTVYFLSILGLSAVLFLSFCWTAAFSFYAAAWAQSALFFGFAWICADKMKERPLTLTAIAVAIILGRLLPELPIRISDFATFFIFPRHISIVVTLISIIAVIPGTVCYREKRNSVYTLSIIILVFLNTFVHWSWLEIYTRHHGFHIS